MGDRATRPFWFHQFAEYLIGLALVGQGLQDPQPLVPSVAGALVLFNVAAVNGPLGAFKLIGRRVHRWLDVVVMAAVVFGALQPWADAASSGRLLMLVMVVPLAFLWFYTDWSDRKERATRRAERAVLTGDSVGRSAGRVAGGAYGAIKRRSK